MSLGVLDSPGSLCGVGGVSGVLIVLVSNAYLLTPVDF